MVGSGSMPNRPATPSAQGFSASTPPSTRLSAVSWEADGWAPGLKMQVCISVIARSTRSSLRS